jgi:hypothetical protein
LPGGAELLFSAPCILETNCRIRVAAERTPSAASRVRPFAAVRSFVVFLIALAGTSAALTAVAPFPKLGNLWRKYHHLREHRADYSLIYVGSSRVFHEFVPREFDAALGGRVKSLNFGQDGMWPPESLYMTRQILALRPPKLRWVLIDLMGIKPDLGGSEATLRSLYWHDWRHTRIALRHIAETNMEGQRTPSEKFSVGMRHAQLWAQRAMGLGHGHESLEIILKLEKNKKLPPLANGGFEVGGDGPLTGLNLKLFEREKERLLANTSRKPIQPALRDAFNDIVAEVRAAGAEPIFIVAAGLFGAERFSDWPPPGVRVLAFDDPAKYPQLYDPADRYDPFHLDAQGASIFTKALAEEFAGVLEGKK